MEGFYVSIVFLGIMLIVISLVWIAFDKKKAHDYGVELAGRKEELIEIINDADQMIDELNKFSDFIVTRITSKQEEVESALKQVDKKLEELDVFEAKTGIAVGQGYKPFVKAASNGIKFNNENEKSKSKEKVTALKACVEDKTTVTRVTYDEKVVPINSRYREVLKLAEEGLCDTEIAKKLGMGKGEIRLVIETNM